MNCSINCCVAHTHVERRHLLGACPVLIKAHPLRLWPRPLDAFLNFADAQRETLAVSVRSR